MFAFLSGWRVYALVGLVVVVSGLGLAVAYYKNSAARAEAEATLARDQRDRAIEAVKAAQETIDRIKAAKEALDVAIVERDRRAKVLEAAKQRIAKELDELKKTLPAEDQDCLDRELPPALLERLRVGPAHPDAN